jgi:hypothetical protein
LLSTGPLIFRAAASRVPIALVAFSLPCHHQNVELILNLRLGVKLTGIVYEFCVYEIVCKVEMYLIWAFGLYMGSCQFLFEMIVLEMLMNNVMVENKYRSGRKKVLSPSENAQLHLEQL